MTDEHKNGNGKRSRYGVRNKREIAPGLFQAEIVVNHPDLPVVSDKVAELLISKGPSDHERKIIAEIIAKANKG